MRGYVAARGSLLFLCLEAMKQGIIEASSWEPYLYVVYYENAGCGNGSAISMIGFTSDEEELLYGGRSQEGSCALESICLVDWKSSQCQDLQRTKAGNMTFSIGKEGFVFQCDNTNTDGECSMLNQCYQSSVYPNCHFLVMVTSELVKRPQLIQNSNPTNLEQQSYLLFYSDSKCTHFEGMQSLASGSTDLAVTENSVGCESAMACLFNPEGPTCKGLVSNRSALSTKKIIVETRNQGRDSVSCSIDGDPSSCEAVSPDACVESDIHPSCHYRWVSAVRLLEDPAFFLVSPTPEPTDAPSQAPLPSAALEITRYSLTVGSGALALAILLQQYVIW